jgi:hypothetical protein
LAALNAERAEQERLTGAAASGEKPKRARKTTKKRLASDPEQVEMFDKK